MHASFRTSLVLGFAVFSMFFGAGNVLYPLTVGVHANNPFSGMFGFLLTGVGLPGLGLFGLWLAKGKLQSFLFPMPRFLMLIILALMLSALGPVGATPRCMILAHASFNEWLPVPMWTFSLILGLFLWLTSGQLERVFTILGKLLSPLLVIALIGMITAGLMTPMQWSSLSAQDISLGVQQGYQTMDLLAALLFGVSIYQVAQSSENPSKTFGQALLIGGGLVSLVYLGLSCVAYTHKAALIDVSAENMLNHLALIALPKPLTFIIEMVVFLACFTTIMALLQACLDSIMQLFDVKKPKWVSLILVGLTVVFANIGFGALSQIITMFVIVLYPLMIGWLLFKVIHQRMTARMEMSQQLH